MHWLQNEQPVEYHVIQWRNSAFHNHDKQPKRKMLGGVSFDGGGSGKNENIQQTGVRNAQPSVPHINEENLFGFGLRENGAERDGKSGEGLRAAVGRKAATGIQNGRDTLEVGRRDVPGADGENALQAGGVSETVAVCQSTSVEESSDMTKSEKMAVPVPEEARSRSMFRQYIRKFGNGIQTFLRGMEQKAGKENARKQPKKEKTGTRAITKEELAQIQQDRTYLLDSYNKNGERSTLGR